MDEGLERALTESTTKIIAWVEQAEGFVAEQAPDVVEQFLAWKLLCNVTWGSVFLVVFVLLMVGFILALVNGKPPKDEFDLSDGWINLGVFCMFGLPITLPGCAYFWAAAAKVWIAPKLVVLEYLRGLL